MCHPLKEWHLLVRTSIKESSGTPTGDERVPNGTSVKQLRVVAVTHDEELKETKRASEKYQVPENIILSDRRARECVTDGRASQMLSIL